MSTRVRMDPADRREVILQASVGLTRDRGSINSWSRRDVAGACNPPTSQETVKRYWLMPALREAVLTRLAMDRTRQ